MPASFYPSFIPTYPIPPDTLKRRTIDICSLNNLKRSKSAHKHVTSDHQTSQLKQLLMTFIIQLHHHMIIVYRPTINIIKTLLQLHNNVIKT